MGMPEINQFLTHLAVEKKVAASTQKTDCLLKCCRWNLTTETRSAQSVLLEFSVFSVSPWFNNMRLR